jgi:hypothetical protein
VPGTVHRETVDPKQDLIGRAALEVKRASASTVRQGALTIHQRAFQISTSGVGS